MTDEINAEFLLTQLYPELDDTWVARHKGTFYRNYSPDAMATYPDEKLTELSRDSMLRLLPSTFISSEDELKGPSIRPFDKLRTGQAHGKLGSGQAETAARREAVSKRLHLLEEAFLPIDTMRFHQHVGVERAIQPILEMKLRYILKEYFFFDIEQEQNPYIREVASLLPYANTLRGDVNLVRNIIQTVTGFRVAMTISDYSMEDTCVYSIPRIRYDICIEDLDTEAYKEHMGRIQPFVAFLSEHFLPFDVIAVSTISGKKGKDGMDDKNEDNLILEYNTTI